MWRFLTSSSFGSWRSLALGSLAAVCCFASFEGWGQSSGCFTYLGSWGTGVAPHTQQNVPCPSQPECMAMALAFLNADGTNGGTGCTAANPCTFSIVSPNCATTTGGTHSCSAVGSNTYTTVVASCGGGSGCTSGEAADSITIGASAGACPVCPTVGSQTYYGLDAIDATGSSCHAGCQYTTPAAALQIKCSATTGACSSGTGIVESTSTGTPCSSVQGAYANSPGDLQNAQPSNCDASGTVCAPGPQGDNCGTFNGDEICVGTIAPGTCVSYASGGVACAASSSGSFASPPDPGSGGTPATANGQVKGNGQTINYYSPATVAAAASGGTISNPVQSQASGTQGVGSGGSSGGGSGSVTVTNTVSVAGSVSVVPNAANGDCGAAGVNCTGTAPSGGSGSNNPGAVGGPETWSGDCSSFSTCLTGFYSSIQSAPIVAGASAIESAWPTGTCDIGSVTLSTFNNQSFNYGTTACQVWNDYISAPLAAILIAVYAVAGVFLVLSA